MRKIIVAVLLIMPTILFAGKKGLADFREYDLKNGLHVILHRDINEPNVIVGVKYHVGAKNEEAGRTGFAHFTEHLMFHGTKNIAQGQFERTIMNAGGYCNAYTDYDVTYYYQLLPAHQFKLGLWVESERMLHPVILPSGLAREKEIVKEEKRMRYDGKVMGNAYYEMMEAMFPYETYGHSMIGSMEDINAATLKDVEDFIHQYYIPNNACLVVAGNIDIDETRKWIEYYFGSIPRGNKVKPVTQNLMPAGKEKIIEKYVKGLDDTSVALCYYVAPETSEDSYVIKVISAILSGNKNYSYFDNSFLDGRDTLMKSAKASAELWENAGILRITGRGAGTGNVDYIIAKIEEQIERLRNEEVNPLVLKQVHNSLETGYTDLYFHSESLAREISGYHLLWGKTGEFNRIIDRFLDITEEDIMRVANKYLSADNRVTLIYHPEKESK